MNGGVDANVNWVYDRILIGWIVVVSSSSETSVSLEGSAAVAETSCALPDWTKLSRSRVARMVMDDSGLARALLLVEEGERDKPGVCFAQLPVY